jgi:hypothetical protein
MAYNYTWPPTLPQSPQKGYTETGSANILSTPMDAGPPKLRYRGKKSQMLSVSFLMTTEQLADLEAFVLGPTAIRGVARFGFPHPRTNTTVEVRILPEGNDGTLYNINYTAPGYYTVTMKLEVLP